MKMVQLNTLLGFEDIVDGYYVVDETIEIISMKKMGSPTGVSKFLAWSEARGNKQVTIFKRDGKRRNVSYKKLEAALELSL